MDLQELFGLLGQRNEQQLKEEKQAKMHNTLVNYYTYGRGYTGYEDYKLDDLFAKFYEEMEAYKSTKNFVKTGLAIAEISNRVLKKLKVPCVKIRAYKEEDESAVMSVDSKYIPLDEIKENLTLGVNMNMLDYVSPLPIFHETKHLSQKYALYNLLKGFKVDNNEAVCGVMNYLSLSTDYQILDYDKSLDELDANLFAINLLNKFKETGKFDKISKSDLDNLFLTTYEYQHHILKTFNVDLNGMDKKTEKQLKESYHKAVEDLSTKNKYFSKQDIEYIKSLNFDQYLQNVNKNLANLFLDFMFKTKEYEDKYNIQIVKNGMVDEENYNKNLATIYEKILKQKNVKSEKSEEL